MNKYECISFTERMRSIRFKPTLQDANAILCQRSSDIRRIFVRVRIHNAPDGNTATRRCINNPSLVGLPEKWKKSNLPKIASEYALRPPEIQIVGVQFYNK